MAILKIARVGHPVLRRVAEPVLTSEIPEPAFQRLLDDMSETLVEEAGAGLAAPQVHVSRRVILVGLEKDRPPMAFINPEISFLTPARVRSYEGCLSVPDMRAAVDRVSRIHVDAFDREGERIEADFEGFAAIAIQHECDHLDGILFLERCDLRTLATLEELRRHGPLDPGFQRANQQAAAQAGEE